MNLLKLLMLTKNRQYREERNYQYQEWKKIHHSIPSVPQNSKGGSQTNVLPVNSKS